LIKLEKKKTFKPNYHWSQMLLIDGYSIFPRKRKKNGMGESQFGLQSFLTSLKLTAELNPQITQVKSKKQINSF
jgi:hypothetical protein